jgi:hypothetical protein
MVMEFGFVAGMFVVMHPAVGVIMDFCAPGVGVHEPVGVIMQVFMGVGVHGAAVAVGMLMDVQVGVAVFMFMLQLPDGRGRVPAIGK